MPPRTSIIWKIVLTVAVLAPCVCWGVFFHRPDPNPEWDLIQDPEFLGAEYAGDPRVGFGRLRVHRLGLWAESIHAWWVDTDLGILVVCDPSGDAGLAKSWPGLAGTMGGLRRDRLRLILVPIRELIQIGRLHSGHRYRGFVRASPSDPAVAEGLRALGL